MEEDEFLLNFTAIYESIPIAQRHEFMKTYLSYKKNPVMAYALNIIFGWIGIDKFYLGEILQGVLKLVTGGGFGIWVLIDLFTIGRNTRRMNYELASDLARDFR